MIKKEPLLQKKRINLGADFLVIGRPIIQSKNPLETIKKINQSIQ
jgi:orotidine-5'-phosphate decarboxylase